MYWNILSVGIVPVPYPININMRCIEIRIYEAASQEGWRLTLTWDVLKCIYRLCMVFCRID